MDIVAIMYWLAIYPETGNAIENNNTIQNKIKSKITDIDEIINSSYSNSLEFSINLNINNNFNRNNIHVIQNSLTQTVTLLVAQKIENIINSESLGTEANNALTAIYWLFKRSLSV